MRVLLNYMYVGQQAPRRGDQVNVRVMSKTFLPIDTLCQQLYKYCTATSPSLGASWGITVLREGKVRWTDIQKGFVSCLRPAEGFELKYQILSGWFEELAWRLQTTQSAQCGTYLGELHQLRSAFGDLTAQLRQIDQEALEPNFLQRIEHFGVKLDRMCYDM